MTRGWIIESKVQSSRGVIVASSRDGTILGQPQCYSSDVVSEKEKIPSYKYIALIEIHGMP
jgi:hypothetical protein